MLRAPEFREPARPSRRTQARLRREARASMIRICRANWGKPLPKRGPSDDPEEK